MIKKIMAFSIVKKIISVLLIMVVVFLLFIIFSNRNGNIETITVKLGNFTNQVSVSGKVIAVENVDLGFSQGGRISFVRAKVGDFVSAGTAIASIENGDLQANLAQSEAGLLREQAKLKSLEVGTRQEQIAIAESSVVSAQISLDQAKRTLINNINDAYTKSDDAIKNKIDQFFQNPLTKNPTISISTNDSSLTSKINLDRISIETLLNTWGKSVSQIEINSDLDKYVKETQDNLNQLKSFLAEVSLVTNNSNSNYDGNIIPSTWKADTSLARNNIDAIIISLEAVITSYKNANTNLITQDSNLLLEKAGATIEDIDAQNAQIKSAEADVMNAKAILNKTFILAPFSGVITKMDAKVGEIVSPNISLITMMGNGTFQIESYVPEVNIAKIKLGFDAIVTLDAYGSDVFFNAKVVEINPAETIRDGVSTYKIKLQFNDNDDRIKSGMTANVAIVTFSKSNVIVLPGGVVFKKSGEKFLQIKKDKNIIDVPIVVGEESSLGQVEIVSGVKEGDQVILNPVIK